MARNDCSTMVRRDFVKASVVASAIAAGAAVGVSAAFAEEAPQDQGLADMVGETKEADVVIVGAGISGITAAVEAVQSGLKTIVLEARPELTAFGGSGMAGVGSRFQKELGIEVNTAELLDQEARFANNRVDLVSWRKMLDASGANIDWLADNGVMFTGVVDCDPKNGGRYEVYHRFDGSHNAGAAFIMPMMETFLSYDGAECLYATRGMELVFDDGQVAGVLAVNDAGDVIQILAKAVVLAGGGFAADPEMVFERYPRIYDGRYLCDGDQYSKGDGMRMATSAGGLDISRECCLLARGWCLTDNFGVGGTGTIKQGCWVNQDGERFANEGCDDENPAYSLNVFMTQEETWSVFDGAAIAADPDHYPDGLDPVVAEAEGGNGQLVMAQTIGELAEKIGIDADALTATVDEYNAMCEAGVDTMYMKKPEYLLPIVTPPFFAAHQSMICHNSIGGICVNDDSQVLMADRKTPVERLYAVGCESNARYRETYGIEVAGSNICGCVATGRFAIQHIVKTLA